MRISLAIMCVGLLVVFLCGGQLAAANETDSQANGERLFSLKIAPVLKDKCLGCHGADPDDLKGAFGVLSRDELIRGGESEEPGIVPGHPDQGTLMEAIAWAGLEMPPKENDRLTDAQIEAFQTWVSLGAAWPDEATQTRYRDEEAAREVTEDGRIVRTSGGTSDQWTTRRYQDEDLWAFKPVKKAETLLPSGLSREDAIDFFVDASINEAGLTKAGEASPRDLIRRVTYDLTGLPPTPGQIKQFERDFADDSDAAWDRLIESLLASPRYGEHWARHWFDVTRYADTGGMSNDFERSNMWRYRDYVIRSFNSDKPYNDFIVEQLAGDELADQSVRDRNDGSHDVVLKAQVDGTYNEQESEWIVATGFLRMGPWDNAMVPDDEARQMYLDDLVNITGQTFLSQTLRCCKCHDHKFDPIPTRDYYSIYAAFATTHMAERSVPFLPTENLDGAEQGETHIRRMLDFAVAEKKKILQKQEDAARAWYAENDLPYKTENDRKDDADEMKPPRGVGLDIVEQGRLKVREQDEWIWTRRLERYQPMAQSVYNSRETKLAWNNARKLRIKRDAKNTADPISHILIGGAITALGDRVAPGVLTAISLTTGGVATSSPVPETIEGRRLALAKWIADENNSLTTRSIVNRVWQYHFGKGIAGNANNFGAKGSKPSHPALLDVLTSDFVDGGWSIKDLHRRILMSQTYRRSSMPIEPQKMATVDPNNELLSVFPRRRMTAEEVRDTVLSATGELVHCGGGFPVMPEVNMEVALQPRMIQFSLAPAYQPSPTPDLRNRRSVYAYQVRGQADPFTELFNQPGANESCEYREVATVTPQVFTLMNSDMMTDRSIAIAKRLIEDSNMDDSNIVETPDRIERQIKSAFETVLLRNPTTIERERMKAYVVDMIAYHDQTEVPKRTYPVAITRSLVEEFSGQTFEYEEILPVFANYQADTKADEVCSHTRAIADMCLLLFNANEFIYVN